MTEKFSNTKIDEAVSGAAIKQGLKTAGKKAKVLGKKAKVLGKKAVAKTKDYLNQPATKGAVLAGAVVGSALRGKAERVHRAKLAKKNESLVEKLDRTIDNVKNEAAFGAAMKGIGAKASSAANKAFQGAKEVGKNTVAGAKKVGSSIKAHPVRTAAIAGTGLAGYGAYKGVKKVSGTGKAAYNNWNA